jgi:hypothetical protein
MRPPISSIKRQEVKREEAWRSATEQEIVKSWLAPAINSNISPSGTDPKG